MPIENSKAHEIKRLTTPLTFKNSKAYDCDGNRLNCIETISDVRYIVEPKEGILTENEILQYAPESKKASKIKLKRGIGNLSDVLLIHDSIPWVAGIYYIALLCIAVPFVIWGNKVVMFVILILAILPLFYLYRITNLNNYTKIETKKPMKTTPQSTVKETVQTNVVENEGLESLKKYEKEVNNLKVLFDVKEEVVKDLIGKRFTPPQLTYDKFIAIIDSSHKLFYSQRDAALNIINLAAEDTPRIQGEVESKISNMKAIINQIEDLTNELVINISSDEESIDEVKNLIDEMENLIDSVKEY